jgi:O-antigen ligase
MVAAPWFGDLAEPLATRGGAFLEAGHAGDRLEIWRGSGAFALQGLPWGHGAGASLAYAHGASGPVGMSWGHAHNNFVQVWLELGAPGALAALVACLALAQGLARLPGALFPQACALLAAGALVALVSHGLWQAWWWSALFIAVIAMGLTGAKPLTFRDP